MPGPGGLQRERAPRELQVQARACLLQAKAEVRGSKSGWGPGLEVKPLGPRITGGSLSSQGKTGRLRGGGGPELGLEAGAEHFSGKRREKGVLEVSFPPATKFYLSTN